MAELSDFEKWVKALHESPEWDGDFTKLRHNGWMGPQWFEGVKELTNYVGEDSFPVTLKLANGAEVKCDLDLVSVIEADSITITVKILRSEIADVRVNPLDWHNG